MPRTKLPRWWAYLDDQGVIRIKRYKNDHEIENCERMFFCKGIFNVFEAANYEHAKQLIIEFLNERSFYEKKIQ